MESRFTAMEVRFGAMEQRFAVVEGRMSAMLALVVRIAERLDGGPGDRRPPDQPRIKALSSGVARPLST
jgi:hypothetical protein